MREISVSGTVRRVEFREWTDKQGVVHPDGSVVLDHKYDKLELGLERGADDQTVSKLRALKRGEEVELLVGISSGENFRADPKLSFLDDLTPRGAAGSGKTS